MRKLCLYLRLAAVIIINLLTVVFCCFFFSPVWISFFNDDVRGCLLSLFSFPHLLKLFSHRLCKANDVDFVKSYKSCIFKIESIPVNDNCSKGTCYSIYYIVHKVTSRGHHFPEVLSLESCKCISFSASGMEWNSAIGRDLQRSCGPSAWPLQG